jgi:hypothetical protein
MESRILNIIIPKKIIIFLIFITLTLTNLASISYVVKATNTIYVDDDAAPDWYDEFHVKTIQEAIDNAGSGDNVFIF